MAGISEILGDVGEKLGNKRDEIIKVALDFVTSNDPNKVIQSTDFDKKDMTWVVPLELINGFVIQEFCDVDNCNRFQNVLNKLYQARVSIGRKGRTEVFDSIKNEQNFYAMGEMNKGNVVK